MSKFNQFVACFWLALAAGAAVDIARSMRRLEAAYELSICVGGS